MYNILKILQKVFVTVVFELVSVSVRVVHSSVLPLYCAEISCLSGDTIYDVYPPMQTLHWFQYSGPNVFKSFVELTTTSADKRMSITK
jgi:hypothetical protein